MPQDPYAQIAQPIGNSLPPTMQTADPYAAIAQPSKLGFNSPAELQPSNPGTVPNARIRNLPNPAANETSPGAAFYHGAKTGAELASIPASAALTIPSAVEGLVGGTVGSITGKTLAKSAGAGELGQEVSGDVGGLVGAGLMTGASNWAASKARAVYNALPEEVQKELVGIISPRLAHLGRLADVLGIAKGPAPVYPGAPLPEHPGTFPGAPLPATPAPEQINPSLVSPARTLPGQIAPDVIRSPVQAVSPVPARAGLALPSAPLGAELSELPVTGAKPMAQTGEALGMIKSLGELPAQAVHQAIQELGPQATIPALTERANNIAKLGDLLNQGLGGKALEPNIPIKNQGGVITPKASEVTQSAVPEGHTPVDSSALKSYKYDPSTREFEVMTQGGGGYVHGDISPDQAKAFEDAPSKGKAWQSIRQNGTLVAKIINGKRIPVKPVISDEDLISDEEREAAEHLYTGVEGTPK